MILQDLTKSALSLTWALSLLGIKQGVNLVQKPRQHPGVNVFAPLAQAAAEQLDDSMKDIYRSGDNVQRRMVDMAFAVVDPRCWSRVARSVGVTNPSDLGDAGGAAGPPCWAQLISLVNPMNWVNPNMVRGMQSCARCGEQGGQAAQTGQQPFGATNPAGTAR